MTYRPHVWVDGELITAEKLNTLEEGAGQAAQPGPQGLKGSNGKSIYAVGTDILAEGTANRTDILGGAEAGTGDLLLDTSGNIYQITAVYENTVTVGAVIGNLKGPRGDNGDGMIGTPAELAALSNDADAAVVLAKVNEIISILTARGISLAPEV